MTAAHGDMAAQLAEISAQIHGQQEVPQETAAVPETSEPEVQETALEDSAADQEPEVQETAEAEGEEAGTQGDASAIDTVGDFIEALEASGWTPEEFYNLKMVLDDGGPGREPTAVTLGQVKDKLQEYTRSQESLAQEREALAQERQQMEQQYVQALQGHQQMSADLADAFGDLKAIERQYASVDWEERAQDDPGRAALEQQQLAASFAAAKRRIEEVQQRQQAEQVGQMQHLLVRENQQLLTKLPAWRDQKVAQRENEALGQYLLEQGYQPGEIRNAVDHRARLLAYKAWKWDQLQKQTNTATTKVRSAPRVMRPGSGVSRSIVKKGQVDALVKRARETGRRQDAIAAGLAELQNSGVKL